jgi:Nickel responsive protein SCO4226-like
VLYTAKCYWPGVSEEVVTCAAARTGDALRDAAATFRGALFLPGDDLVLCLFDATSRAEVKEASEAAGMPCERVIETVWVAPPGRLTAKGGRR